MTNTPNAPVREPAPRIAPAEIHAAAPGLGWYSDNVLFGEVWERQELGKRDRSIVTITALITRGQTQQLTGHFNRALTNGVTPTEIVEIVTHLAFYAGWPCAMSAVGVMQQVFTSREISPEQVRSSCSTTLPMPKSGDVSKGNAISSVFEEISERVVDEDLWRRTELAVRDRHLVTLVTLIVQSEMHLVPAALRSVRDAGLTYREIGEVLAHLAFYIGWPRLQKTVSLVTTLEM